MNLRNFETRISEVILKRGLDYFRHGHVVDVFGVTATNWQAEVEGTDTYIVDVQLNEPGEIVSSSCDCPYDSGRYCKHEVAVFYALREVYDDGKRKGTKQEKPTLQQLLEAKKKDELVELILSLASTNTDMYKELLFEVSQQEDEMDSAKAVILHHISMAKNKGFIEWNKTSKALKGVAITLNQVREKLEESQYEMAIQLSLISLKHSVELLSYADDSSGDIGYEIDDSLACIEEAVGEGVNNWSREEKEVIFAKIVEEALDEKYDGWAEWRYELLKACVYFCTEAKFEEQLKALLESMLEQATDTSWEDKFTRKQITEIQFQMVIQKNDKEAVEGFLVDNLMNHSMREKAVLYAFDNKEYEKALQLSIEGEQVDKALSGVVQRWTDYQYKSYQYLGDKKAMQEIAFTKVLQGNPLYYEEMKTLYAKKEWQAVVSKLLSAFDEKQYYPVVYLTMLIEESDNRRLLEYCRKNPSSISTYHKYLVKDYFVEVEMIFSEYIRGKASAATKRSDYRQVCEVIQHFQKACGQDCTTTLIDELRKKYRNRPAFLDELGKV